MPEMIFNNVDLPTPDTPLIASISLAFILKLILLSIDIVCVGKFMLFDKLMTSNKVSSLFTFIISLYLLIFNINAFADNQHNVLLLGDSLSASYGVDPDKSWTKKLSDKLEKINYELINSSVSGETTSVGLEKLPSLITEYQPHMVIIALGSNDGLRALPTNLIKNNIQEMVNICHESKAKVALIGFKMPPNYGAYSTLFANIFPSVAKDNPNITFIPFFLEEFADDLSYFQSDTIHPNEKAQDIIFNAVYSKINFLEESKKD